MHLGARLVDLAEPGEILASSTVRDLVAGSGIRFGDGRDVELAGIAGNRTVLPVVRQGVTPNIARRLASEQANVFRRDGEYWTVGYGGLVVTLRDSKGLHDLAHLLTEPRREIHVLDLIAERTGARSVSASAAAQAGLAVQGRGEPVIDQTALAQYKHRIAELETDIDQAHERGDGEMAAVAQEELDALITQLTAAYGLGGRSRRTPDQSNAPGKQSAAGSATPSPGSRTPTPGSDGISTPPSTPARSARTSQSETPCGRSKPTRADHLPDRLGLLARRH